MPLKEKNLQRMRKEAFKNQEGLSLLELMISMTLILILMAAAMNLYASSFRTRQRESNRTDALTSARSALDSISREIANSGYGLESSDKLPHNGIVWSDSNSKRIHFRANIFNNENPLAIDDEGEDVAYYYEPSTRSILRFDRYSSPQVSTIVNRISDVTFEYFDNAGTNSTATQVSVPTKDTSRVRISVEVTLENVTGQPANQKVTLRTEVALRNSRYMLNQY
jgi:prepilin-type N-terminal cleavage/methylation domain-containing protein